MLKARVNLGNCWNTKATPQDCTNSPLLNDGIWGLWPSRGKTGQGSCGKANDIVQSLKCIKMKPHWKKHLISKQVLTLYQRPRALGSNRAPLWRTKKPPLWLPSDKQEMKLNSNSSTMSNITLSTRIQGKWMYYFVSCLLKKTWPSIP